MKKTNNYLLKKPVVLCIGTDKVIGDRLGPLVGDALIKIYGVDAYVYGNMESPVNGKNFISYVSYIKMRHKGAPIVAVDACVGKKEDVGKVKFSGRGLTAGGAVNRDFERIGDIGILGVVAESGSDNLKNLIEANGREVERLASAIAVKVSRLIKGITE